MHLTILSRGAEVHSTRRLVEAAHSLGHRTRVVDPSSVLMELSDEGPRLYEGDRLLRRTDVVVPRIAQSINTYGLALVNQFDAAGVTVLNNATAISHSRNKMRLMQMLVQHGLSIPPTVIGRGVLDLNRMVELVGGLPVVIKLVQGAESYGIIVCETIQSMKAAAETVLSMGHNIIVQRYVSGQDGRDLRALVVGGEVLAAVRRHPAEGKVRHSLSTGARLTKVRLTADQRRLAVETARVVGLEVAAVDLLDLRHAGTQVYEVHSSPGLRELEATTGEDLALPIVERAVELAQKRKAMASFHPRASAPLRRTRR